MTSPETLLDLASRIARLSPDRRDPEKYHAEKSEIAAELRRLAGQQSSATVHKYSSLFAPMTRPDAK
ncbi:hypothetical protein [Acidiphilium sp. 37-64-53]|nr:hypothetical protein [Acidiphilium sp. 37-64-53]